MHVAPMQNRTALLMTWKTDDSGRETLANAAHDGLTLTGNSGDGQRTLMSWRLTHVEKTDDVDHDLIIYGDGESVDKDGKPFRYHAKRELIAVDEGVIAEWQSIQRSDGTWSIIGSRHCQVKR